MPVVIEFNRTLDQELAALARGVSLECLVCGEFVIKRAEACFCPECGSLVGTAEALQLGLQSAMQAG